ncbi:MAG: insulinase family protein [Clostridiales bacterium]|nr:insulinase family protein [Clostridiales bacterium]
MKETKYTRIGEKTLWTKLANGLSVCIVPKPGFARKYAFFSTRYGGMDMRFQLNGEWLDTPAGIAHYLEHKMFDTEEGNALQDLTKNGAEPNAFTSNAITAYYFDSTEHFYDNLKILLSFVSVPYFTEESVAKEQGIIGQEIGMIEDNPEWQVYKRLIECLYKTSPARVSVAGSVESISHITAQTLYDCHKAFYTPSNMCLCVVGDVDAAQVLSITEEILPKEGGPVIPRDYGGEENLTPAVKESVCRMEVSMPSFLAGFKCRPGKGGEAQMRQNLIGDLACDVLMGESSPLYAKLYADGLINGSFGSCYEMLPGVAYAYAGGDSNDPKAVQQAIIKEAARLVKEGIDDAYYQRIVRANFGSTLKSLNSFENIAVSMVEGYFHGYDPYRFPEVFDSIGKEDLIDFLRENIVESHGAISIINPKEESNS